ncbi:MAG: hypothetical protein ACYDGM_12470, partial [Vulcanimicrobiaceae bacterium]
AEVGALAHDVPSASLIRADPRNGKRHVHLARLERSGLATPGVSPNLPAIATPEQLRVDLALVEIIAHWITMLANADRIARDDSVSELEVAGYAHACETCKARWGFSRVDLWSLPPFHPACSCFAQPRYVAVARSVRGYA